MEKEKIIAEQILHEIHNRLTFLINVGLDYLTLSRTATTLSGGEAQRIRLATQIGSGLVGVLYILDEPEAGLSPFRLMELLVRITRMAEEGSQFIIATHSPILLAVPDATILEITADGLAPVTYDQATIVQATREFLDNPRAVVDFLLAPED